MARKIFKYKLSETGRNVIKMPERSMILKIDKQFNDLCLWADVETRNDMIDRIIYIYPTGIEIDSGPSTYLNTVVMGNGLVWHVYDKGVEGYV